MVDTGDDQVTSEGPAVDETVLSIIRTLAARRLQLQRKEGEVEELKVGITELERLLREIGGGGVPDEAEAPRAPSARAAFWTPERRRARSEQMVEHWRRRHERERLAREGRLSGGPPGEE